MEGKYEIVSTPIQTIIIVGLGLIGGSLAGACRKALPHARIIGVTRSRLALKIAKQKGWIHEGFTDLGSALTSGSTAPPRTPPVVILCTPVDTLKDFLVRLDRMAPLDTLVTDAGSVKGFLVRWADRRRWRRIQFIGAHPVAGSHEKGIRAAGPGLFKTALTLVTPGRRKSRVALRKVMRFWAAISGRVRVISPELHDRWMAEISHFPHLMAALVVHRVSNKALGVATSGFLDTTRIAQGDPSVWTPIFLENRKEIIRLLAEFERQLRRARSMIEGRRLRHLRRLLGRSQRRRIALEDAQKQHKRNRLIPERRLI